MKIGFLQFDPQARGPKDNISFIISQTKNLFNSIIVLPELFLSSYFDVFVIESSNKGKVLYDLINHSIRNNLTFVGSLAIKNQGKIFNQGVYIKERNILNLGNKKRLFDHENNLFSSGKTNYKVIFDNKLKYTIQICLDNINPIFVHKKSLKGLDCLFAPCSVSVDYLWKILQCRALENQIIVIFCNRIGKENNGIIYLGKSTIFLPTGKRIIARNYSKTVKLFELNEQFIKEIRYQRNKITKDGNNEQISMYHP